MTPSLSGISEKNVENGPSEHTKSTSWTESPSVAWTPALINRRTTMLAPPIFPAVFAPLFSRLFRLSCLFDFAYRLKLLDPFLFEKVGDIEERIAFESNIYEG